MTAAEAAAADSHNLDEVEEIDPDQASDRDSTVGSKRRVVRSIQIGKASKDWLNKMLVLPIERG